MKRVRWDRVIGALLILFMFVSFIDIMLSKPVIKTTPVGEYTCNGHLIKICSGSTEVSNYLGIE